MGNIFRSEQNCQHLQMHFSKKLSLTFVSDIWFDNKLALIQVMAWYGAGDKLQSWFRYMKRFWWIYVIYLFMYLRTAWGVLEKLYAIEVMVKDSKCCGDIDIIYWICKVRYVIKVLERMFMYIWIVISIITFQEKHQLNCFNHNEAYVLFNSLGPNDTIWQHRSGSTLAQVMACCLTAPSHYLNQCWVITNMVQWQSPKSYFTINTSAINY